jgi:hypothetical protein
MLLILGKRGKLKQEVKGDPKENLNSLIIKILPFEETDLWKLYGKPPNVNILSWSTGGMVITIGCSSF